MRLSIGIAIGVAASVIVAFVLTLPFSWFLLIVTVNEWRGIPCGGLC